MSRKYVNQIEKQQKKEMQQKVVPNRRNSMEEATKKNKNAVMDVSNMCNSIEEATKSRRNI